MAQSYDVYFARMILTKGLLEREPLQRALVAYQRSGEAGGFPRFLVAQGLLDGSVAAGVTNDLERWFFAQQHAEESSDGKSTQSAGSGAAPAGSPPTRAAAAPASPRPPAAIARPAAPPPPGARPAAPPPRETPTTEAQRASRTTEGREAAAGGASPATRSSPVPGSRRSSGALPVVRLEGAGDEKPRRAVEGRTASSDEGPKARPRESARLRRDPGADDAGERTPALRKDPGASPTDEKKPRASARLPRTDAARRPSEVQPALKPAAERPGSERTRETRPAAAKVSPSDLGTNVPEIPRSEGEKQWALFERATKDPLQKLVGRKLGRTEIVRLVHTGEMVTAFEGKFGEEERAASVKVLRPDRVKDKVAVERFSREAALLAKVDHPNIARVLESGTAEGVRFFSMEIGSGEPLSALLERGGRLPPDRVVRLGRGTALGLAAAHREGVVHRDLRPANILIEGDGTVKLVGFGVARDVSVPGRLTATGQITGHPSYVAPEVAMRSDVTGKADVYSLGIVLYLALAGRLPFESRSVVKLVGLHLNAPPPPLATKASGVPQGLADLVLRLLAKNPDDRPDAAEAANLLASKTLLDGAEEPSDVREKLDSEEELRRAMATDEHPAVEAGGAPELGGPACAACELPLGARTTSLHGNSVCTKCLERVESLDLCAACLHEIPESDRASPDAAVFAGHMYCRACTARVRLTCAGCRREALLSQLTNKQAIARGDLIYHATCLR